MMGHVPLAPVVVRWLPSESPWKVSWGVGVVTVEMQVFVGGELSTM